uniref:Transducin/WD40 repeat-like superfamily protein n=1 Tax=Kalanchoe fedtschenkoi TaxID=63787 RepID=A0A7N1A206_KALFE
MDRYLPPSELNPKPCPRPRPRPRWERFLAEIEGEFSFGYLHRTSASLTQSYAEIGAFPHFYHIRGAACWTHVSEVNGREMNFTARRKGVSALGFDSKGIYMASVTPLGCLTVHEYEHLYCQSNLSKSMSKEDENKHMLHLSTPLELSDVKWNPVDQTEVACTSLKSNQIPIFDITYISSEPIRVFKKRESTALVDRVAMGLTSVAFTSLDNSRVLASDIDGSVHVWDRRKSDFPFMELCTSKRGAINSIRLDPENKIVFGAGKLGVLYMWDLRGGRSSTAFQNSGVARHFPFTSVKIASMLEKIEVLKRQSNIVPKEVHSIDLNPSCPYQLAFHLDDGWSGVVDINHLHVSHVHCPPPVWLEEEDTNWSTRLSCLTKPSWLPKYSKYAVGSSSRKGIYLLDFYPDSTSACHVDYECGDDQHTEDIKVNQNRFISLSAAPTVCAAHPLTSDIVVGTKEASLLVVSQKRQSFEGEYEPVGQNHT